MSESDDPSTGRRLVNWFLIGGSRRWVAVALLLAVGGVLLVLNVVWPLEFERLLTQESTVQQLFLTLLSGIILLVSIVVSINSLVVSQELTPIGSQHERVVESWDFRTETARAVESDVAPASPDEFLRELIAALSREHEGLSETIEAATTSREARSKTTLTTPSSTSNGPRSCSPNPATAASTPGCSVHCTTRRAGSTCRLDAARTLSQRRDFHDDIDESIE